MIFSRIAEVVPTAFLLTEPPLTRVLLRERGTLFLSAAPLPDPTHCVEIRTVFTKRVGAFAPRLRAALEGWAMTPSDLLLAAMLLSAPFGTPEQQPSAERWPSIQNALHEKAIEWELLDPREIRYVLAKIEDFQEDLDFIRKRRAELLEAPLIGASNQLPDRRVVNDYIQFNRAYKKHLETRMLWEADRAHMIREALTENERLYKIWDSIREAKSDFHYITVRRQALKKLRESMGTEQFDSGVLPEYVPEWRFVNIR